MRDYTYQLTSAAELARKAGQIIMDIYSTDFSVAYKGEADPVTEADKRANEFIVEGLNRLFPHDLIVAEESAQIENARGTGPVWYVDPLDGTKEFISRNGEFSVMIGLALDGHARALESSIGQTRTFSTQGLPIRKHGWNQMETECHFAQRTHTTRKTYPSWCPDPIEILPSTRLKGKLG